MPSNAKQNKPSVAASKADSARLLSVADACLRHGWSWVARNTLRFLPSDPSDPETMKQISELALVYGHTLQWLSPDSKSLDTVGEFLLCFLQRAEISHFLRKRPAYYNAYSFAYLALRMTGTRLEGFERALAAAHRAGYPAACEKIPFRAMELEYLRWRAGLTRHEPAWELLYRATTLTRCKNPAYLVNWEVYSITHTLFYWTDFCGPASKMRRRECNRAVELLEIILVNYWRRANWDIVGELLLNLVALDRSGTPLFALCADSWLNAWRSDGTIPGPKFAPEVEQPSEDYIFERCYHTTLVGLLLCAAYSYRSIGTKEGARSASA
jgi:hypothetical protein